MMKLLIISLVLVGIFIVFQSFIAVNAAKTEKQKFRVILKEDRFEIRFYPSATMATIYSNATNYKGLASNGFRKLARYIFGGNEQKQSISMTAPVRMNMTEKGSSMSFVMPEKYNNNELPTPNDKSIDIQQSKPVYVASISFSGYATDVKIKSNKEQLEQMLKDKHIKMVGEYSFLGYNAPYDFFGRTNEIIIPIEWKE
jgi:hypothetical protein